MIYQQILSRVQAPPAPVLPLPPQTQYVVYYLQSQPPPPPPPQQPSIAPFEELLLPSAKDPAETFDRCLNMLRSVQESDILAGIDLLRVLNKFHFAFLCSKLPETSDSLFALIDSTHPFILSSLNTFLCELCGEQREESLHFFVAQLLPHILWKHADPESPAGERLRPFLDLVCANVISPEIVDVLCQHACSRTWPVSQISLTCIKNIFLAPWLGGIWEERRERLLQTWAEVLRGGCKEARLIVIRTLRCLEARMGTRRLSDEVMAAAIVPENVGLLISAFYDQEEENVKGWFESGMKTIRKKDKPKADITKRAFVCYN